MTTKIYARRDSATAVLRKLGINPRDYNLFIKTKGAEFHLDVGAAEAHLKPAEAKPAKPQVTKPAKPQVTKPTKPKVTKPKVTKPVQPAATQAQDDLLAGMPSVSTTDYSAYSCAGLCRKLIADGLDNAAVWEIIAKQFNLDDTKRHYPSWYRSQMKRKAMI